MDFNGCAVEMDLTTAARPRDPGPDQCKSRAAKSVFSIRSLVDLGDAGEQHGDHSGQMDSKCFVFEYL